MPHVYDSGIEQLGAIRNAIVARLGVLMKSAQPPMYLRAIVTLPRPLRGEGDKTGEAMLINALLGEAPAVAIALGRLQFIKGGGAAVESDGELEVAIYVCSQHNRSLVEGRLYGDSISAANNTVDPGVFTMLQHVRERLAGQELQLEGVNEMNAVEQDEVLTADNMTVWEQRYQVVLNTSVDPARGITQLLTSIESNNHLDGIPEDGEADPFITAVHDIDPPEEP